MLKILKENLWIHQKKLYHKITGIKFELYILHKKKQDIGMNAQPKTYIIIIIYHQPILHG